MVTILITMEKSLVKWAPGLVNRALNLNGPVSCYIMLQRRLVNVAAVQDDCHFVDDIFKFA